MIDHTKINAMREGGKHLGHVKQALADFTQVGMTFAEIEAEAQRLIKTAGAKPSFSTVPGYSWATCIMKNDELCHGIPADSKRVENGDIITVDVGLLWNSYHLDTTTTFVVGKSTPQKDAFLAVGRKALAKAIERAKPGNSVYDISFAMQKVTERAGFSCVYQLCGHGIGKKLHDKPDIPCLAQRSDKRVLLQVGQTIAVEIMYAAGNAHLKLDQDGWTYRTSDGSISGMFEETVLVTEQGPEILTAVSNE
jgi:methionyl aminopeptidase